MTGEMTGETRWWLVRHAPVPEWKGRIYGCLDIPCDTSDTAAFAAMAARLPREAVLIESGLSRCRRTAEALAAAGLALPDPIVEPALQEQDFGDWATLTWAEIDAPEFWRMPAEGVPPGGESFAQVVDRVRRAVHELTAAHEGRDILAVVHGGTIRAALAAALDIAPQAALRIVVEPLSLTRLDRVGDGWRVRGVNALP